jgi:ketosteroid isomerase-like protein
MSAETTQAVLENHLQCFGANDLDGIMSDYTDDTVFLGPDGPAHGLSAIRDVFAGLFQIFPAGDMELEMKQLLVDGEYAYILWSGSGPAHVAPLGTDTYHVRDGKFVMQTFAAVLNAK